MELINIAILTGDAGYGEALAWGIVRNTRGMDVWVYTDEERMYAGPGLKEPSAPSFDLVLIDTKVSATKDDIDVDRIYFKRSTNVDPEYRSNKIYLVEKPGKADPENGLVYRYGNVRELTEHLFLAYAKTTGRGVISDSSHECELYTFIAEKGGCGCTSRALSMAERIADVTGRRVLFVSLDQFISLPGDGDGVHGKRNIKQFLYHLMCRKESGEHTAIGSYVQHGAKGVDIFIYPPSLNPLMQLYESGYVMFMEHLLKHAGYEVIVFDAGNQISMQMIRTMQMSDRIFFIASRGTPNMPWRHCIEGIVDSATMNNIVPAPQNYDTISL